MTRSYKKKRDICRVLSFIFTMIPVLIYVILGFIKGTMGSKISLGVCLVLALVFTLINVLFKHRIRCTLWILIIGIYVCIDNIIPLLFIMAASTAIDEFILHPLAKKYNNLYTINKEIDKRS